MLIILIVVGTAIWVGIDAKQLGAKKGKLGGGFFDMGPLGWMFGCLLLWILCFPVYLAKRSRYKALRDGQSQEPNSSKPEDSMVRLERLTDLKTKGTLTDEEFQAEKKKILSA